MGAVIAAGAVAGAISAILALVSSNPAAARGALATDVMVQNEVESTTPEGPSDGGGVADIVQPAPFNEEETNDLTGGLALALKDPAASPTDVGGACEPP